MKKFWTLSLLATGAFLGAGNIILNPSFEELNDSSLPLYWKKSNAQNKPGVLHRVSTDAPTSGKYSAEVEVRQGEVSVADFIGWIQDLNCSRLEEFAPGTHVMLSFDFITDAPGTSIRAYVEGKAIDNGFSFMGPTASRYVGWGKYQLRFKMPEEKVNFAYVVIQLLTTGSVRIDNVELTRADNQDAPTAGKVPEAEVASRAIDLKVDFLNMPAQHIFDSSDLPGKLRIFAQMDRRKFRELQVVLGDETGKTLREWKLYARGNRIDGTIELPKLADGFYTLKNSATILGQNVSETSSFRVMTDRDAKLKVRFRPDHIMVLNGKPFFPIMVCPPFITPEALRAYNEAGFNTITPQLHAVANENSARYFYELAARNKLNVIEWINMADSPAEPDADLIARIRNAAEIGAKHSNFIGFLNDEDAWRSIPIENEKRVHEFLRQYAPGVILWVNQAPRGSQQLLRRWARYCDVSGADVYPVPNSVRHNEMPNQTVGCIGDYTDDFVEVVDDRKPVWMILQAWSWGGPQGTVEKPFPTAVELRFMFYNAILHGATGIAWFDNNTMNPDNPVFGTLAAINLEFAEVADFIMDGKTVRTGSIVTDTSQVNFLERGLGKEKLLILLNESDREQNFSIKFEKGTTFFLSPEGAVLPDQVSGTLKPFEAWIASTVPGKVKVPASFTQMKQEATALDFAAALKRGSVGAVNWRASWVWDSSLSNDKGYSKTTALQKMLVSGDRISEANLSVAADNSYTLKVNGKTLGSGASFKMAQNYNIAPYLQKGENLLEIDIINSGSSAGVFFEGYVKDQNGYHAILSGQDTTFRNQSGRINPPEIFGLPPVPPWGELKLMP